MGAGGKSATLNRNGKSVKLPLNLVKGSAYLPALAALKGLGDLASSLIATGAIQETQEARDLLEPLEAGLRRSEGAEAYRVIVLTNLMRACTVLGDHAAAAHYREAGHALQVHLSVRRQQAQAVTRQNT